MEGEKETNGTSHDQRNRNGCRGIWEGGGRMGESQFLVVWIGRNQTLIRAEDIRKGQKQKESQKEIWSKDGKGGEKIDERD